MTERTLDKHRLTQIQWHLCTVERGKFMEIEKISIVRKIRKSLNPMFSFLQLGKAVRSDAHSGIYDYRGAMKHRNDPLCLLCHSSCLAFSCFGGFSYVTPRFLLIAFA